ncbi:hypothetical protein NUSPORA_00758 [Nucleospora cyclopteri]
MIIINFFLMCKASENNSNTNLLNYHSTKPDTDENNSNQPFDEVQCAKNLFPCLTLSNPHLDNDMCNTINFADSLPLTNSNMLENINLNQPKMTSQPLINTNIVQSHLFTDKSLTSNTGVEKIITSSGQNNETNDTDVNHIVTPNPFDNTKKINDENIYTPFMNQEIIRFGSKQETDIFIENTQKQLFTINHQESDQKNTTFLPINIIDNTNQLVQNDSLRQQIIENLKICFSLSNYQISCLDQPIQTIDCVKNVILQLNALLHNNLTVQKFFLAKKNIKFKSFSSFLQSTIQNPDINTLIPVNAGKSCNLKDPLIDSNSETLNNNTHLQPEDPNFPQIQYIPISLTPIDEDKLLKNQVLECQNHQFDDQRPSTSYYQHPDKISNSTTTLELSQASSLINTTKNNNTDINFEKLKFQITEKSSNLPNPKTNYNGSATDLIEEDQTNNQLLTDENIQKLAEQLFNCESDGSIDFKSIKKDKMQKNDNTCQSVKPNPFKKIHKHQSQKIQEYGNLSSNEDSDADENTSDLKKDSHFGSSSSYSDDYDNVSNSDDLEDSESEIICLTTKIVIHKAAHKVKSNITEINFLEHRWISFKDSENDKTTLPEGFLFCPGWYNYKLIIPGMFKISKKPLNLISICEQYKLEPYFTLIFNIMKISTYSKKNQFINYEICFHLICFHFCTHYNLGTGKNTKVNQDIKYFKYINNKNYYNLYKSSTYWRNKADILYQKAKKKAYTEFGISKTSFLQSYLFNILLLLPKKNPYNVAFIFYVYFASDKSELTENTLCQNPSDIVTAKHRKLVKIKRLYQLISMRANKYLKSSDKKL